MSASCNARWIFTNMDSRLQTWPGRFEGSCPCLASNEWGRYEWSGTGIYERHEDRQRWAQTRGRNFMNELKVVKAMWMWELHIDAHTLTHLMDAGISVNVSRVVLGFARNRLRLSYCPIHTSICNMYVSIYTISTHRVAKNEAADGSTSEWRNRYEQVDTSNH